MSSGGGAAGGEAKDDPEALRWTQNRRREAGLAIAKILLDFALFNNAAQRRGRPRGDSRLD